MDILLIKLGALGDVINTLPLAVQLKHNLSARIHWLVAPLSYPIVSRHPCVDEAILFDKTDWRNAFLETRKTLKSRRFDMVLDLQRILKSGLFCLMADSQRRIGFDRQRCKEMTWLLPFERIPAQDPSSHMLRQYLEFAAYLGIRDNSIEWGLKADFHLRQGLPARYVVLNIGATKSANQWPAQQFATLADRIFQQFGFQCILTGGREDVTKGRTIRIGCQEKPVDLTGQTSLEELMVILQQAEIVITCDTGPMHLAVALGTKVIALFGPSDPRRTGPFQGQVIQQKMDCMPCNRKSCKDAECMNQIQPHHVIREISRVCNAE